MQRTAFASLGICQVAASLLLHLSVIAARAAVTPSRHRDAWFGFEGGKLSPPEIRDR